MTREFLSRNTESPMGDQIVIRFLPLQSRDMHAPPSKPQRARPLNLELNRTERPVRIAVAGVVHMSCAQRVGKETVLGRRGNVKFLGCALSGVMREVKSKRKGNMYLRSGFPTKAMRPGRMQRTEELGQAAN
jgi:hypothetical protein